MKGYLIMAQRCLLVISPIFYFMFIFQFGNLSNLNYFGIIREKLHFNLTLYVFHIIFQLLYLGSLCSSFQSFLNRRSFILFSIIGLLFAAFVMPILPGASCLGTFVLRKEWDATGLCFSYFLAVIGFMNIWLSEFISTISCTTKHFVLYGIISGVLRCCSFYIFLLSIGMLCNPFKVFLSGIQSDFVSPIIPYWWALPLLLFLSALFLHSSYLLWSCRWLDNMVDKNGRVCKYVLTYAPIFILFLTIGIYNIRNYCLERKISYIENKLAIPSNDASSSSVLFSCFEQNLPLINENNIDLKNNHLKISCESQEHLLKYRHRLDNEPVEELLILSNKHLLFFLQNSAESGYGLFNYLLNIIEKKIVEMTENKNQQFVLCQLERLHCNLVSNRGQWNKWYICFYFRSFEKILYPEHQSGLSQWNCCFVDFSSIQYILPQPHYSYLNWKYHLLKELYLNEDNSLLWKELNEIYTSYLNRVLKMILLMKKNLGKQGQCT
jgi:hypothetical protein